VAPSTSANKVAKLASRGKGKKVRFQGGTVFPAVVAVVVILMLGLVIYARASRPTDGSGPPRLGDHWHASYGFYVCDTFEPNLLGSREAQTTDAAGNTVFADKHFQQYGIHSHGDGVIHYHPYGSRATGTRARLGVFLDAYNVKLTDTTLTFPADQGGLKIDTKNYKCNGEDAQLKVRVWNNYAKTGEYVDYVTDFKNIRIDRNGMAFTVAVVPKGKNIPQPDSAPKLPELGAADGGSSVSVPGTDLSGSSTTVTGSTVVGDTTVTTVAGSTSGSTPASTPSTGTTPATGTAAVTTAATSAPTTTG
jgi:hypothetical protein